MRQASKESHDYQARTGGRIAPGNILRFITSLMAIWIIATRSFHRLVGRYIFAIIRRDEGDSTVLCLFLQVEEVMLASLRARSDLQWIKLL